ncbi:MAG: exo-alpha-sialidase [Acidobacteria bacterium]|nr:exo-alpha-sialidase [Acidobacteriota bacterium]
MTATLAVLGAAPARETTLAVPGRANANVSLAAQGSFATAVWSASTAAGETDIFSAVSSDGGRTFSKPVRVNSTPGDARVNGEQPPRVAVRSRSAGQPEIAVVWTTKGSSGTKLLSAVSTDGGRSFSTSTLVPGSDAAGNRGWEGLGVGPDGRFITVWLDHRKLADPQQQQMAGEHHHHEAGGAGAAAAAPARDGVAMAQLSQLYVASVDGVLAPKGITGGVCYCCKTAIASGPSNALYLAWRHVYPNNMRDIAFTVSRDGGRTFGAPIRVSEDKWQIEGCPDDGPSMAVDPKGAVHVVWPSVVTESGRPVKALFHAVTRDGRTFTPRTRIPTQGMANHPQLAIDQRGALAVTWDESGSGSRTLALALGSVNAVGSVEFSREAGDRTVGTYPVLAAIGPGQWLRAWTVGDPATSQVRLAVVSK